MDLESGDVLKGEDVLDEGAGEDDGEGVAEGLEQLQHHQAAHPAHTPFTMHTIQIYTSKYA